MAKKSQFEDPLEDIDPIMEEAYSVSDEEATIDESINSALEDFSHEPAAQPTSAQPEFPDLSKAAPTSSTISDIQFPNLSQDNTGPKLETDIFSNIPVTVSVELGRSQISLKEVFELTEGSIIELDRLVGEPLDLVVNGQIVAQGEVVAIDNNYGLRVTNVVSSN